MDVAIVGCGFVADYYLQTLKLHPELRVLGLHDRDATRSALLGGAYGVPCYASLDALLDDERVQLVINLTNPHAHHAVSKAALERGKHVYSEKPLALHMDQASELVELAESRGLQLASAPCSLLGETAQAMWRALREGAVGRVRLAYAEMDDGLVHRMPYRQWRSASGLPWPWEDEFAVGCTLEHAGYVLSWLAAFFGPATTVNAFASVQVPDKLPGAAEQGPDFSVACIRFASGVVARLTCGIVAPHDHALTIVGDEGVLYTPDCWHYRSPVRVRRMMTLRRRSFWSPLARRWPLPPAPHGRPRTRGAQVMDFARGPAELAAAVREGRPSRLSARFSLHVNELALAIHGAGDGVLHRMRTRFDPIEPMPWAT